MALTFLDLKISMLQRDVDRSGDGNLSKRKVSARRNELLTRESSFHCDTSETVIKTSSTSNIL